MSASSAASVDVEKVASAHPTNDEVPPYPKLRAKLVVQLNASLQAFAWLHDRFPVATCEGDLPITFDRRNPSCFMLWRCTEKGQHGALDVLEKVFDSMKQWVVIDIAVLAAATPYASVAYRIIRTYAGLVANSISPLARFDPENPEGITEADCQVQLCFTSYASNSVMETRRRGKLLYECVEALDNASDEQKMYNKLAHSWEQRRVCIQDLLQKYSSSVESLQAIETIVEAYLEILYIPGTPLEEWFTNTYYNAPTVGEMWLPYISELIEQDSKTATDLALGNVDSDALLQNSLIYPKLQAFLEHFVLHQHQGHDGMHKEMWAVVTENIHVDPQDSSACAEDETLVPWMHHDILFAQLIKRLVGNNFHVADLLLPMQERNCMVDTFLEWKKETEKETAHVADARTPTIYGEDEQPRILLATQRMKTNTTPEREVRRKWHEHLILSTLASKSKYLSLTERREDALKRSFDVLCTCSAKKAKDGLYGSQRSEHGWHWHHRSLLRDTDRAHSNEEMAPAILYRTGVHEDDVWEQTRHVEHPRVHSPSSTKKRKHETNVPSDEEEKKINNAGSEKEEKKNEEVEEKTPTSSLPATTEEKVQRSKLVLQKEVSNRSDEAVATKAVHSSPAKRAKK